MNGKQVKHLSDTELKIGIRNKQIQGWAALDVYLINFVYAIKQARRDINVTNIARKFEIINDRYHEIIDSQSVIPDLPASIENRNGIFAGTIRKLYQLSESYLIDKVCKKDKIDVIFAPSIVLPARYHHTPWVSWIPDFQHLHLPELFNSTELADRDYVFKKISENADCVILSSQSCFRDYRRCFPTYVAKVRVLPFVAQVPNQIYDENPLVVCKTYNIPEKYFYLPNQFWKHKNHKIVIDALKVIHQNHPEIVVVCSGGTGDYRNQDYFSSILNEISTGHIRCNFIFLGFIPKQHVFQLMRQSCAVIQPSLFEGWSTTIEEAKSLGKKVILSNIPVHREQNPPGGIYFNPHDPEELATILIKIYDETVPGPDLIMEEFSKSKLIDRTNKFGEELLKTFFALLES